MTTARGCVAEVSSIDHLRLRILLAMGLSCLSACGRDQGERASEDAASSSRETGGASTDGPESGVGGAPVVQDPGGTGGTRPGIDDCYGAPFHPATQRLCVPAIFGFGGAEGDENPDGVVCPQPHALDFDVALPVHVELESIENGQCCFKATQQCFGRPLLTPSGARVAAATLAGKMNDSVTPEAKRLGTTWLAIARAEHASVASFQRLGLELLQLGAPLDLIRDAARAALDEIDHAELAGTLVTRFLGKKVSFDSLDLSDVPLRTTFLQLAQSTAEEGCIHETLSLVVLQEQRRACKDAGIQTVLDRLIADETRHVEISWRLLGWLVSAGDAGLRGEIEKMFAHEPIVSTHQHSEAPCKDWGELDETHLKEVRRVAWRDLIRPCAKALLIS
jgi:hypothetical protein